MEKYDYEKLLDEAYAQLPKEVFERRRFEIPKVISFIEGKRTLIQNFKEIADTLNRDVKHVLKFFLRELATAGEIEGTRAVFKGQFSNHVLNEIVRRYAQLYVICPVCKKPDTRIVREGRFWFLVCEACGARTSIKPL
ncbi:MAG: translation initiation factor IF-2 subunit beta [Candidatus Baldrarchaeia archaeon]|nr:translation initiation factor IF-2 subunit beta [Candidatus Odinarchaeota archaeon]